MANLLVRNVDDGLVQSLRERARRVVVLRSKQTANAIWS